MRVSSLVRAISTSCRRQAETNVRLASKAAQLQSPAPKPAPVNLKHDAVSLVDDAAFSVRHAHALKTTPNRLLSRDFIHDSLYNLDYGYFSKKAVIFSPPEDVDFNALRNSAEFTEKIAALYREYDDVDEDDSLQVWHTPTELFKV
jgi:hypothetical protein